MGSDTWSNTQSKRSPRQVITCGGKDPSKEGGQVPCVARENPSLSNALVGE